MLDLPKTGIRRPNGIVDYLGSESLVWASLLGNDDDACLLSFYLNGGASQIFINDEHEQEYEEDSHRYIACSLVLLAA